MKLVPLITVDKRSAYEAIVKAGGEGVMLKDLRAPYVSEGRPKGMYKVKRFEEVDAFVVGGERGDADAGWNLLIGNLDFGATMPLGGIHVVARCSNLTLEDRIAVSVCARCSQPLRVDHANVNGKRVVQGTHCSVCDLDNPDPAINPTWMKRVACIKGQEWTSRVFRLKHAVIERWRDAGEDAKPAEECTVDLVVIKKRFERASVEEE